MRITRADWQLLHVPLARPRASPQETAAYGRLNHIVALLLRLDTDSGASGLGFAYAVQGSGRALLATAVDDLTPLIVGEDPLDHERLEQKTYWRLQTIGRRGLVQQAYSAVDVALWDLKGKVAGLPLYKLLGGARTSATAYGSDTGWLHLSPDQILDASRPYVEQGMGLKVKIGLDPEKDAGRLQRIRDVLGEDVWLAVDANERYDFENALAFGRFLDEEIAPGWYEEPITCEDPAGHARLAAKLETPIAGGEMLFGIDEFRTYLERGALAVVQPDVTRLGGITATLRVIALADLHHRPVSPHLLPEIGVHLACGLPRVTSVEYMPWLAPLWTEPARFEQGRLVPPPGAGLGLQPNPDAVGRYRIDGV
jgi:L-alanine-DL-glutamate epimerase-like enolase superfamily enzyme